jgi:hypothetical protein
MTSLLSKTAPNYQTKEGDVSSLYVPQPFLNYAGLTKMLSSDYKYVPKEPSYQMGNQQNESGTQGGFGNTLFQGSNTNNKNNQNMGNESEKNGEEGQEEDTIGFWINNINTGDVYRSFIKGTNPWAKSHAFTQPLQKTRGAFQYYQNAYDSPIGGGPAGISLAELKRREEQLRKEQEEAERRAREEAELQERIRGAQIGVGGVRQDTSKKILTGCIKKGWIGLCSLKCFLKQNNKNNSDIIDKNTFNILLKKQGILLEDTDIESICDAYDTNKTDYFNFIQFFNALRNVSNTRGAQIESFKEQVKSPGQNYIVFSDLLKMADMNYHPEAIKFIKSVPDLIREYENNWRKPKDEDRITEDDFRQFFYDVSTCVPNDVDFTQILKALGYK